MAIYAYDVVGCKIQIQMIPERPYDCIYKECHVIADRYFGFFRARTMIPEAFSERVRVRRFNPDDPRA